MKRYEEEKAKRFVREKEGFDMCCVHSNCAKVMRAATAAAAPRLTVDALAPLAYELPVPAEVGLTTTLYEAVPFALETGT